MSDTTLSETHITQDNGISIQNSSEAEKKWGSNKEEIDHVNSVRHRSKEEAVAQMTVPCVTEKTKASSIVTEEADEQITEATAVKSTAKGHVTEPHTEHSLGRTVSFLKEGHVHETITAVDSKEDLAENAASMPCQSSEQQTVAECAETENPAAVLEKCSGSANSDDATATAKIIRLTHSYVKTSNIDTKPENSTVTLEISKPSTYEHELESNVSSTTQSVNSSRAEISEKDVVITEQDTCPLVVETSYDYTHTITSPEVQSIAEVVIPMSSDDGMHNRESLDSTCKQPNQSESALSFSSSSVNAPTDTSSSVNTPSNTSSSVNAPSDTSSTVNVLSDTTSSVNAPSDTSSTVNVLSDTTSSVNAPSDTSSTVNVLSDISTSITQKNMQDSTKSINSILLQKKQGNQKSSQKPGGKLTSLLQRLPLVSNQTGAKGSSTSTKLVIKHDTIVNDPAQSNTSSLFGDSTRVASKEESLTQDKPPTSTSQKSAVCLPQTSQGLSHQNVSSITQLPLYSIEKNEDNSATTQFRHRSTKRISVKIIKSDESQKPDFEVCSNSPSTTSAANNKQTAISHTTAHVFLDARKDYLPKQHLFSPEVTAVVASGQPSLNVADEKGKSLHCLISSGNLEGPVSVYKGKRKHIPLVEGSSEADPKPVPVQAATVKPRPQISLLQTPGSRHLVFKSMSGSTKSPAAYSLLANSFTTPNPRFRFTHPTSEAAGVSISTAASSFLPVVGMQGSAKPSIVPYLGPNTLLLAPPYQLPAGSQIILQPVPCAMVTSGQTKTSVLTTPVHTKITTTPVASQISTVKTGVQPLSSAPQAITSSTQPVTSSVLLVPTSQATSRTTILTISTRNNSKSDVPSDTSNRSKKAVIFEHAKPEKASTTANKGPQLSTTSSASTHQIYSKLITRIVEQSLLGASADKNVLSQLQGAQVAVSQSASQQTPQSVISAKSNTASSLKIVNSHDLRLQTSSNSQSLQAVKVSDKSTRLTSPSLKISTKDMSFMSEVAQTTRTISTVNNSNLKSVVISSKPVTVPAISSGEPQSVQQQPHSLKLVVPATSKAISLLNTSYRTETQNSIVLPFQSDTVTASNPSVKRLPRSKAVKSTNSQIITKRDVLQPSTQNPLQNPCYSVADFKRLFTVPNTGASTKSKNSIYSATLSTGQGPVPVKVVVPDVDDDSSDATSDTEIPKPRLPKALATLDKDVRATASNKDVFSDNKTDIQISDLRGHVEPDTSVHGAESVAIYVDEESDSDLDIHNIEEQDMSVLRELLMGAKSTRLSEDPAEVTYQAQVETDQRTDEVDFNSKSVPKNVRNSFIAQEVSDTTEINVHSSSRPEVVPSIYLAHEVPCSDKAEGHLSSSSTSFEEPLQSSFKSKEQSGPEISDVLGQPVNDIPKDKNMGQSFREMLQDDIIEQTIRELPEGDIAGQKIRELPEDITGQTIRELPEDDFAGQTNQELPENDITGQSVTDLPEDDQFCALKIESVFSLSGSVDTEDTEFQTDNSNAQSEFETFSNRQEQVFNVRESDDWKRIIYPSFVVLERMSRSEILGAVSGDIPSKCSGHCRKRTLDYLCNLGLLTCMNHPDSSLFLKPKKLRVVAKRSLRKITKHELVNKKPYAYETLDEPYTPCSPETTVLHKEKLSKSSSPSMGETPQPPTAPDTYSCQAEGSCIPVKDDQKVDDKISPHLNIFISSSELKEFQADLEQLQEQVDRKRTKMQSEKLSRKMKEVAVVKNKNKTIHKKSQETLTTKTMPTLSDSNVNSTGRSFSEDISANKIHLGSLPKVSYSSSGKNVSSDVVSAQQAIPPNERKEKIIKISPVTKRSARILMPKPRTEKNVPAVDIKGSNVEVKSQTNASTAAVPGNTSPTMQSLPTGKIKAALESLTSYLAATGRKPTEGNTQYILLKIEDQHVLVKLPSSSSSTAQLGKTKLSRVKTVSVKSSPADQSLIGHLRKTSHQRGQLNIAKTISSINTSSRVSKTASNLNIAPAISSNNTASDLTKSASNINGAPAVSGSVSSKNISTIFAKTVSILNAKTMASAKAASEVSKMASNKTPLPSGSEKIDDAEKLRLCTKKITAHVSDGGVTEKTPLHAAKAISRKTGVFVPSSQQTDDISVLQGRISESRNGSAMEVTNVDETPSSRSSKITQRSEVRAVSAASEPTVPSPDLISSAVSHSSLRGRELSNVVLSCLPSNSALLPERRIKRSSPLTQEERTAKRRRLEAKYPLPPGVVIKAEPDDSDYASSIDRPDSSQALFSGDISIASTSQMVSCDSQFFLDQTWSVENLDDSESSLTLSTNVEDQISASRRNVGFVDFPVNSSSYLQEQMLPTELFESEEGSSEELDEPPALVDETMTGDPNHHPQEDEVIDILEDTPPVLQPMFTSSSALAEDRDIIELKNTDLFKDKSTHLKVLSSSRSEMIPALKDSVIATESSSGTSLLSQSSLDSGIDTSIPSSSTSYTSIAGTSKSCLSDMPRYKNQKILHLKELLKKKEMEIENIKRMRSEFPSLDLDNI